MIKKIIFHFLILTFCFCYSISRGQQNKIDSLCALLKNTTTDTNRVNHLIELSGYYKTTNPDTSIIILKNAVATAENIQWGKGTIKALLRIGSTYSKLDLLDSSKVFYTKAIQISRNLHEDILLSESLIRQGRIYYDLADYTTAINNYIEALNILEKNNIKNYNLGSLYHYIGSVFKRQDNMEKAKEYYKKEYALAKELNDNDLLASSLYLLSQCEDASKEQLKLLFQALKICEKTNDKKMVLVIYANLIDVYHETGEHDKSIFYALKSVELTKQQKGNNLEIVNSLCNLAQAYNDKKDYKTALKYLNEVKEYLPSLQKKASLAKKDYYRQAYKAFQGIGDYQNALNNYKEFADIQLESLKEDKIKSVAEIETKYDANKKSLQIQALEKEKVQEANITRLEKKKQLTIIWSITGGLLLVIAFASFVFRSLRITRRQKGIIEKQKEEVDKQREIADSRRIIAEEQKEVIQYQKALVEEHQREIVDSITYAKRIQYSLLANKALLDANLPEHFILFKPKDIVSGDFYWATKRENKFYLAACDSTGHGVPGAFMSLLNISFLNEAINEKNIVEPHHILNHVRQRLIENVDGGYDGMDAILVCIEENNITYAAANNSPTIIKNGQLISLATDKMPVGKGENKTSFTLHTLAFEKNDCLYLYTDGYADQFGGPHGKKFKYKQLDELLISISNLPAAKQMKIVHQQFESWKGNLEQVDDVLIIGIRL
jgi:serine phosphatase RsbU (regulator of sigma subunit)